MSELAISLGQVKPISIWRLPILNRAIGPRPPSTICEPLEIKRKIGDVYYQAVITLNLGGVYLNQGDLDQAWQLTISRA